MSFIEQYKAALITTLITGVVTFGMFSFQLKQSSSEMAETFYDIEPEIEEEIIKEIEESQKATTNKAFNEDEEFKNMMKNFKSVSANDFEKTTKQLEQNKAEKETEIEESAVSNYDAGKAYALKQNETESYEKLKDVLNKKQHTIAEHASGNSTLTYSLKGRRLLSYDTPRYLCERSGKIVVSITVDASGNVIEAAINGSSNSNNECLIEHAIEYAQSVQFNSSNRANQIGSITFYFKGKN
ncbi:MAG: hypothetical protein ED556_01035 [Winogradskyella sp.]|uniref:hypothetical protein n=1 Tax=Winogradskyella sp. TaxID=1883156 RepID=UPI000F3D074A|nr:hypothetical protein [Winogradskyella sp.]RNC87805.1 MAG: hypothetical protein ED556_01035 [Winogradskyella sp.]